ncbi:MAG: 3-deoxy-D-manno-octulosonic acid transferase [Flavobacteriaceae bacterium]
MWIYQILVSLFSRLSPLFALVNSKLRKQLIGQRNSLKQLPDFAKKGKLVWIHVASLGEYEQALPIIDKIKERQTEAQIALSFFSPSGYEYAAKKAPVEFVFYLPWDIKSKANKVVQWLKPDVAIFVKYELWPNYLNELKKFGCPTYLVAARFYKEQWLFKYRLGEQLLENFNQILCQDESSISAVHSFYPELPVNYCGDTRFDRVAQIAFENKSLDGIESFIAGRKCIVFGSSWQEEHELLAQSLREFDNPKVCFIVAPHKVDSITTKKAISSFSEPVNRFTKSEFQTDRRVLILDTVGLLSAVYRYADLAFIGGGFKTGLHNVPEAAVYGIPVLIGPNYSQFPEVVQLVKEGGVIAIDQSSEFDIYLQTLAKQPRALQSQGEANRRFIEQNLGASDKIYKEISKFL